MKLLLAIEKATRREPIVEALQKDGWDCVQTDTTQSALAALENESYPVIFSDLELAESDKFALVRQAKQSGPNTHVILITGVGSLETAVEAIASGAFDYITSPYDPADIVRAARRAADRWAKLSAQKKAPPPVAAAPKMLVGRSTRMLGVYRQVAKATASQGNVLILAETGTGKELVARAIHANSSRKHARFLAINCAALTDTLLESELFGHTKGAFTGADYAKRGFFEEANGGSLFLDELGDLSQAMQIKLLRVLQEREIRPVGSNEARPVDVRILAATHRNLEEAVQRGTFREDLYYRLRVLTITLPPLRERLEDLEELSYYLLHQCCIREQKPAPRISEDALQLLRSYHWPGNVRELEHAIESALVNAGSNILLPEDFPADLGRNPAHEPSALSKQNRLLSLDELEKEHIERVLTAVNHNVSKAAEILGIDRGTLYRKAERYTILLRQKPKQPEVI